MTLNEIISQQGAPIYYTPINVWADIYQPNPMDAIANPTFINQNNKSR